MALLRAKQIKVETGAAAGHVLKVVDNALTYGQQTAADVAFDKGATALVATDVNAAIIEVAGLAGGNFSALQAEVDATQAGAGLSVGGAYEAATEANYIAAATSLHGADLLIDAALKAVDTAYKAADVALQGNIDIVAGDLASEINRATGAEATLQAAIDGLTAGDIAFTGFGQSDVAGALTDLDSRIGGLTNLSALHFAGVADASVEGGLALPTNATQGDVLRVTGAGTVTFGEDGELEVLVGDFVAYVGQDAGQPVWVKFDNTDPVIAASGALTATPNATGYDLTFDATKVNFIDLAGVNAPAAAQEGKFLQWTAAGLAYVDLAIADVADLQGALNTLTSADAALDARIDAIETAATVAFATEAFAGNATFALVNAPVAGSIVASVNGLVAPVTVDGQTVTITAGYGLDADDAVLITYSYMKAATPAV